MGFISYLLNKLKFRRLALSGGIKILTYGAIYYGSYSNWKHDPKPTIFVMYSGQKYTHAINVNYLNRNDKMWFGRMIYNIKRGQQNINGITLYRFIKMNRISIIKTAYRVYFTNLLNMKLVSGGITYLDKMAYTSQDPWILTLNEMIKTDEIKNNIYTPRGISYSSTELQDRIIEAYNSKPITNNRIDNTGPFGRAKWLK